MLHHRHTVTQATIGETTWHVDGSLAIVVRAETTDPDWELVATTLVRDPLDPGAYRLSLQTSTGSTFTGDAILVRQVDRTWVFRGVGPLTQ
ncbi:MAG: hypothetical protein H6512_02185 [Acidimicrobiia bacterium]|nr:hypothetical protein [Acidimicrobiia bacterium]